MTGWPYCALEVALYAVFAAMTIGIVLDGIRRWRQLVSEWKAAEREPPPDERAAAQPPKDEQRQDDTPAISGRRVRRDDEDDDDPPPFAA